MNDDDKKEPGYLECSVCQRRLLLDGSENVYCDEAGQLYCESCAGDELALLTIVADLSGFLDF